MPYSVKDGEPDYLVGKVGQGQLLVVVFFFLFYNFGCFFVSSFLKQIHFSWLEKDYCNTGFDFF